ncbi:S8 family serine peptidase [Methylobacterium nodulans]|uniref:Peptidase S8 and S53 subtilisin kexin sedolisin n=1 Tax=Methylobacterium nodulans (strain LMG 21967 / CNCM I-2342 / ORS 2060) TaxID=460265 RepID=B8II52_METNO|nr:S8 family serine peptidase [Methylobacterium nodulans]ACL57921.1 peptidase S8 and S53 subtilisin kexin sedolisin [Methylobacterium nodulans ORS 2060]
MVNLSRHLQRRIEFIRDTAEEEVHEVIVTIKSPDADDDDFTTGLLETLQRRGVSNSARDLLPVSRRFLSDANSDTPRKRNAALEQLKNEDRSLIAYLAQAAPNLTGAAMGALTSAPFAAALQKVVRPAVNMIANSDIVQNAAKLVTNMPGQEPASQPVGFWTSSSVLLKVQDQGLQRLVEDLVSFNMPIQDVFPNQRLSLPPVATPKSVPGTVEDNRISAWGLRSIGALSSWGAFGCRGQNILVGLLDTGVDPNHPDLKGKIAHWAEFDEQGRVVPGSVPHDTDKHGTHCASTICGGDKSGRWIGVAPKAKLAAGIVLNGSRGGTLAQILAGIDWAVERQVDVISMSLGSVELTAEVPPPYTRALSRALRLGIPVVTAIGNSGSQTTGAPGNDILALAVGATDHMDRAAGFSGGRTVVIRDSQFFPANQLPIIYSKPEVSAPGVAVYSSVPGGKWEYLNGTSMAAPHVAGAIALLLSGTKIKQKVPSFQRAGLIQDLLTGSAEELGESGQNHRFGFGRIDVLRALGFARDLGYC